MVDVNEKLRRLLDERGWTYYRLAKSSGLSDSTLANVFRRNTVPAISTLESICSGFGITLAQFFSDGEDVQLTDDLRELFDAWLFLTPAQKEALLAFLRTLRE